MIPSLLLLAAITPPNITIEVNCSGGLRPAVHRAALTSDGTITSTRTGYAPSYAMGHVDPDAVAQLSARLDAIDFDRLSSPKVKYQVYDGVTCAISRSTLHGAHCIVFDPGSEIRGGLESRMEAVRAVMDDAFKLASTIEPQPTQ